MARKPLGRPSDYNEEMVDLICGRLMEGESLLQMCKEPALPHISTVFRWMEKHETFRVKYARAREVQGHVSAEMAIQAAVTAQDAQLGRLAYDARKWHAAKLAPRTYGDKTEVAVTGPNGGPVENVLHIDAVEAARAYQRLMGEDK